MAFYNSSFSATSARARSPTRTHLAVLPLADDTHSYVSEHSVHEDNGFGGVRHERVSIGRKMVT